MINRFCIAALLLLSACESTIVVEIPDEHKSLLVVDGTFSLDDTWDIGLSKSLPLTSSFDYEDLQVQDATVIISNDLGYSETLTRTYYGRFTSPTGYLPQPGVEYYLRASADTLAPVTASSMLRPAQVEIVEVIELVEDSDGTYRVRFTITDPPGSDHYSIEVSADQGDPNDPFGGRFPIAFSSENGMLRLSIEDVGDPSGLVEDAAYVTAYFSDALFDGRTSTIVITLLGSGRNFELAVRHMSPDYFAFHRSLARHDDGGFVSFGGRPEPLHSNVEGGLGLFAGYSVTTVGFEVSDEN